MERVKIFLQRLIFPPLFATLVIAILAFGSVGYVLLKNREGWFSYLVYFISAYALVIVIPKVVYLVRHIWRSVKTHPLGKRLTEDIRFRTEISLYQGFVIDLFYIALEIALTIYDRSLWFAFLASYYALLAIMRFLLFYPIKKAMDGDYWQIELRRYRLCGIMLLVMNQSLVGMVVFIVRHDQGYEYPGMLIYAMAAYAFYAIILAIINVIKFRKHASPALSAAKAIDLVAAMVSILALETAMLTQFGSQHEGLFRKIMTAATGGSVCLVVLGIAIYMIVGSTKGIRQIKRQSF